VTAPMPGPTYTAGATLRDRCRAIGLPVWRCDTGGAIVEEPVETGLARLWLGSGHITALVSNAARAWSTCGEPDVVNPIPGCWLIPIVEDYRRRRSGLVIAMALGPEILDGEPFDAACRSAGLDAQAARGTVRKLAVHDAAGARAQAGMLRWMMQDLSALSEHQTAVSGFTTELGQSYETIDLLYSLGRSMLDLRHPENFVTLVCDRLFDAMPFGWLAVKFMPDPHWSGASGLWQRPQVRGKPPGSARELEAAMDRLAAAAPAELRAYLAPGNEPLWGQDGSRVLVQPVTLGGKLAGLFVCGDKTGEDPQVSSYDMQLLEAASGYCGAFLQNAALYQEQLAMFLGSLRALTAAIDAKDRYTCGHSERVALVSSQLALAAGLDQSQAERVHICGLVHDVGKIGVPEAVLCKPGRLTDQEFDIIKLHPTIGHTILKGIPMLQDVLPGVLHHHERFDGKGYPMGLSGRSIPLFGRILAVADTFDAMSSTRSYRSAMSRDKVLGEIQRCAGAQFDPDLVAAFAKVDLGEYDRMAARHATENAAAVPIAAAA